MEDLRKQFKTLKTPQRADLISDFIYIHTKLLKNKVPQEEDAKISEAPVNPSPASLINNNSSLPSNTPSGVPYKLPADQLPSTSNNDESKKTEDGIPIFKGGKYTKEFKKIAVTLARQLNNNTKAARDLSQKYDLQLKESSLRDWRKEIDPEQESFLRYWIFVINRVNS